MVIGEDSPKAILVLARLAEQLHVRLQVADFFEHLTLPELAALAQARLSEQCLETVRSGLPTRRWSELRTACRATPAAGGGPQPVDDPERRR